MTVSVVMSITAVSRLGTDGFPTSDDAVNSPFSSDRRNGSTDGSDASPGNYLSLSGRFSLTVSPTSNLTTSTDSVVLHKTGNSTSYSSRGTISHLSSSYSVWCDMSTGEMV